MVTETQRYFTVYLSQRQDWQKHEWFYLFLFLLFLYYCKLMFGTVSIPSKEFPLSQLQKISPTFLHTSLCLCVCVRKVTGVWQLERGKQNGSCSDISVCSLTVLTFIDQSFCVLMCSDSLCACKNKLSVGVTKLWMLLYLSLIIMSSQFALWQCHCCQLCQFYVCKQWLMTSLGQLDSLVNLSLMVCTAFYFITWIAIGISLSSGVFWTSGAIKYCCFPLTVFACTPSRCL